MTNAVWDSAREGFTRAEIDWDTATIKAGLARAYLFGAAHKFVSDLTGAGGLIVATTTLTTKTAISGAVDADDPVFTGVAAGPPIPVAFLFQASAVTGGADVPANQQRLIAYFDQGTNLPITPNGQPITWNVDPGINKLFRL